MTDEKCLLLMEQYREILIGLGAKEAEVDYDVSYVNNREATLNHCLSMILKMESFIEKGRRDKFFRWLGFMQGAFFSFGLFSLNELRDHNRPPE